MVKEDRTDRNHWRHQLVNTITVSFLVANYDTQTIIMILWKLENLILISK